MRVATAPCVSMGECAALAMWMTFSARCSACPFGRAKGGVRCDPTRLSEGNVGAVVARELAERGARIVAVSDVTTGVAAEGGLDVGAVMAWVADHGFLRDFPGGEHVGRREILGTPCASSSTGPMARVLGERRRLGTDWRGAAQAVAIARAAEASRLRTICPNGLAESLAP